MITQIFKTRLHRLKFATYVLLLSFSLAAHFAFTQEIPQPQGWVNDFANVISDECHLKLTNLIQELEEKTTSEIVVVTVNSIAPYGEKEYARLLFDNWKPGKKGKDNGVLVLLAVKERRWRIETGYGIEGILPDGLCGEIGRNYMVAYFKEGKYSQGLYQGVVRLSQIIAKDANISLSLLQGIKDLGLEDVKLHCPYHPPVDPLFIIISFLLFFGILFLSILLDRCSGNVLQGSGYRGGGGHTGSGEFGSGGFGGGFGGFDGGRGGGGGAGGRF